MRQRQRLVRNPKWASDVIAQSWHTLQAEVPQWLPRLDLLEVVGAREIAAEATEHGCGKYGCVYPTLDPNVVLKITTDDTEAEFAANLSSTLVQPICTEYYRVARLALTHKGYPVYLLWRQDAHDVGRLYEVIEDRIGPDAADDAASLLIAQHKIAQSAYMIVKGHEFGDLKAAMNDWVMAVAELAVSGIPILEQLFQGVLEVYNEQQIFFGDLHQGNLGAVTDADTGTERWVITDPGHVAVVDV